MRRPSSLNVPCGLSSALAEQFPETSDAAEGGATKHRDIYLGLGGHKLVSEPAAAQAVEWARACTAGAAWWSERKLVLIDPETRATITEGTADLVVLEEDGTVTVWDFKTGRRENVTPAADNLQLAASGMAAGMELDAKLVRWGLAFVDEGGVAEDLADPLAPTEWWPWLDRLRAEAAREQSANPGPHCGRCFQRKVCPSYRERAALALTLLPGAPAELTDETAVQLVQRIEAVKDAVKLAEDLAKAHVNAGGRVLADGKIWKAWPVKGRRSGPSVADCEAAGLGHMVKEGKPGERWEWRRA